MVAPFGQTMRSLTADGPHRSVAALLLVIAMLIGWTVWLFCARIAVSEVADSARLEVDGAVHSVQAVVSGRVVSARLSLGQRVQLGEVLVELDVATQRLQLQEAQAQLNALEPQFE